MWIGQGLQRGYVRPGVGASEDEATRVQPAHSTAAGLGVPSEFVGESLRLGSVRQYIDDCGRRVLKLRIPFYNSVKGISVRNDRCRHLAAYDATVCPGLS